MVKITKDMAAFIRKRLPEACIVKTLKNKGGSNGTYFIECTNSVLKLINEYNNSIKVVEIYPFIREE